MSVFSAHPYSEYRSANTEWLVQLPKHWTNSTLGFNCSIKARLGWKGLKAEEYVDEGYIFLATPNIKGKSIDFDNVNYITKERFEESPEIIIEVGDVLVTKDGSTTGTTNLVINLPGPATVNSSIAVLRSFENLDSSYLYHFFTSLYIQNVINRMRGGMGVPHLFQADLRKFFLPLPPLQEQTQIAKFLDYETAKIDALIDKQQQLIALLKEKRQAVISHAVTKGLNPDAPMRDSGVEWLGEVPGHWGVVPFRHALQIANGQVDPRASPYSLMLLIAPNHIESGTGRLLARESAEEQGAISGKYEAFKGDVIYSKIRPALRKVTIAPETCLCSADMYALRPNQQGNSDFFCWLLLSEYFSDIVVLESMRVAMPKVNRETLAPIPLPIPGTIEQREIADFLSRQTTRLDALVEKTNTSIDLLQERRTALISAAVTGKIDVRDWKAPEQ